MMNFKGFKKMSEDKHSVTMGHPKGHLITIHKGSLPALQRKQLDRIPLHMAAGGTASDDVESQGQDAPAMDPAQKGLLAPTIQDNIRANLTPAPLPPDDIGVLMQQKKADITPPGQQDPLIQTAEGSLPPEANTAAPESTKPIAKPTDSGFDINKSYQQGQRAIDEQKNVDIRRAKDQSDILIQDINARQELNHQAQRDAEIFQEHQKQLLNDYANGHINPNHYQESLSSGQKVATAIGLLLGGFSGGFNKTGVNPAADFLNKQIDRDIESQRAGLDQKKTILSANQDLYKDQVLATNATRMNMNDFMDHKIQLAAAQLGTPAAKAAADAQHAKFALENGQLLQQSANRSAILHGLNSGNGAVNAVDLVNAGIIPKEYAQEALKEQSSINAQKAALAKARDLFTKLDKEQRFGNLASPQSYQTVAALKAELVNTVMSASASKRLTHESIEQEINPLFTKTRNDNHVRGTQLSTLENMITNHADPTPLMQRYAPNSLPQKGPNPFDEKAPGQIVYTKDGRKGQVQPNGDIKAVK